MKSHLFQRGDTLRLEIASAAFEGKAVARVDGLVVFVDGGVPGDVVQAKITRAKRSHLEAVVLNIERASPLRVQPRCVHFGVCGGCRWQHLDYAAQLRFKQQHVIDAFERIGGIGNLEVLPIIGSEEAYGYRNKMEYSFSDRQWVRQLTEHDGPLPEGVYLGLHVPQRFDRVLDLEECHLQSDLSIGILKRVRAYARASTLPVYSSQRESGFWRFLVVRQSKRTSEVMVNIVTSEYCPEQMEGLTSELLAEFPTITTIVNTINSRKAQVAYGEQEYVLYGPGFIREELGGYVFEVSAGSFFQTNTPQAERLYGVVRDFAQPGPDDTVFDLYSGTGTIAIFLSRSVREVVGIESAESAIRDAERNARKNGITNCRFVLGDLKDRLTRDTGWMASYPMPRVIVIDPPRSGMHPKVVDEVGTLVVPRIVYVSCNPATQARDARLLCSKGYRLVRMQPVDMFPHTYHVENVALFERDEL